MLETLSGHPNIVQYYGYFEENEIPYLVMEFLDGNNLFELLEAKGKLEYPLVFDYIYQIGLALIYVHSKKMVHRDVQPKNIMIEKIQVKNKVKTRAVLIDFGIVQQPELMTNEHPSISNFTHYEQKEGIFNPKFDVYCLAACLYNALTNELPTDSGERRRRRARNEKYDLIPPTKYNEKIKKMWNRQYSRAWS
jgi:serine/threonine-protein kinase